MPCDVSPMLEMRLLVDPACRPTPWPNNDGATGGIVNRQSKRRPLAARRENQFPFAVVRPKQRTSGGRLRFKTVEDEHASELARASEELRQANHELEEFAYVTGHDLREPLRMINIYTELLIQECGPTASERARQFSNHIQNGVVRMEQVIEDVLQYSQVIHQQREIPVAPISLRRSLDHALAVFRDRLDAVQADIQIGELPVVLAEEMQIALVFQNLLSNSLKYAHPERKLQLRVWAVPSGNFWTIYFSDNGIGFEPEFAERIFGLFKRLHGRDVPGTGLGLAICRRIIERYGGNIRAEARPQQGATFIFSLKGSDDHEPGLSNSFGGGQSR